MRASDRQQIDTLRESLWRERAVAQEVNMAGVALALLCVAEAVQELADAVRGMGHDQPAGS